MRITYIYIYIHEDYICTRAMSLRERAAPKRGERVSEK